MPLLPVTFLLAVTPRGPVSEQVCVSFIRSRAAGRAGLNHQHASFLLIAQGWSSETTGFRGARDMRLGGTPAPRTPLRS